MKHLVTIVEMMSKELIIPVSKSFRLLDDIVSSDYEDNKDENHDNHDIADDDVAE